VTLSIDRRNVLKLGGGLAALPLLGPKMALADTARLTYWHALTSQTDFAGLEAVMQLFAAAHPEITLTQEQIPNPEYMAKVTTAVVANNMPDALMVTAGRQADLVAMNALIDITEQVNAWPQKADFPNDRWDSITIDGKIYGIPAFTFVDWMYYRKDWFDELGIKVPTNYPEFLEAAIKVTDPSKNRYGFSMRGAAGGGNFVIDVMEAFGAPVVHGDKVGLDRAPAIEALRWYTELFTKYKVVPPSAPSDGFQQIMTAFQTGQTAMIWHHTASFFDMSAHLEPGVQFATAKMPAGPATHIARVQYGYNSLTKLDKEDAALEWIKYWGTPDAAVAFLQKAGYFPASPKLAQDPRIMGNPIYVPAVETLDFGRPPPKYPGLAGWNEQVVLSSFQSVLIGQMTVEDAIDHMIAELEALNP
jgi:multiple sugar transport system substrate-binding protein